MIIESLSFTYNDIDRLASIPKLTKGLIDLIPDSATSIYGKLLIRPCYSCACAYLNISERGVDKIVLYGGVDRQMRDLARYKPFEHINLSVNATGQAEENHTLVTVSGLKDMLIVWLCEVGYLGRIDAAVDYSGKYTVSICLGCEYDRTEGSGVYLYREKNMELTAVQKVFLESFCLRLEAFQKILRGDL